MATFTITYRRMHKFKKNLGTFGKRSYKAETRLEAICKFLDYTSKKVTTYQLVECSGE
jgi:hypothetical protein